jgi:hypothetical protein
VINFLTPITGLQLLAARRQQKDLAATQAAETAALDRRHSRERQGMDWHFRAVDRIRIILKRNGRADRMKLPLEFAPEPSNLPFNTRAQLTGAVAARCADITERGAVHIHVHAAKVMPIKNIDKLQA